VISLRDFSGGIKRNLLKVGKVRKSQEKAVWRTSEKHQCGELGKAGLAQKNWKVRKKGGAKKKKKGEYRR